MHVTGNTFPTKLVDQLNQLSASQNRLQSQAAIVNTDVSAPQADEENLLVHFGSNGALQAQLDATAAVADLAETLVRLTQTQSAYTAALQSGAKILSSTLLDYLR